MTKIEKIQSFESVDYVYDKLNELVDAVNKQAEEISFLAQMCKRYEDEKDAEFEKMSSERIVEKENTTKCDHEWIMKTSLGYHCRKCRSSKIRPQDFVDRLNKDSLAERLKAYWEDRHGNAHWGITDGDMDRLADEARRWACEVVESERGISTAHYSDLVQRANILKRLREGE